MRPPIVRSVNRAALRVIGVSEPLEFALYLMQRAAGMPLETPTVRS
ncbi:MAG: hypothetical protein ABI671_00490 [Burkholderiales bacterium]